jgi:hypothetical protein
LYLNLDKGIEDSLTCVRYTAIGCMDIPLTVVAREKSMIEEIRSFSITYEFYIHFKWPLQIRKKHIHFYKPAKSTQSNVNYLN